MLSEMYQLQPLQRNKTKEHVKDKLTKGKPLK